MRNLEHKKSYMKEYHKRPKSVERARYRRIFGKYGITKDNYEEMLESQKERCAICKKHRNELCYPLVVDHNHKTGKVRGLLCRNCNVAIGQFFDNKISISNSLKYLEIYDG